MKTSVRWLIRITCGNGILFFCFLLSVQNNLLLAQTPPPVRGGGVLVFGPHPDDAVLGCSGIILQAHARGEQVHVVLLTNGDAAKLKGFDRSDTANHPTVKDYLMLSRLRQLQARKGLAVLGLKPASLILLGYPDSGLEAVYHSVGSVSFISPQTRKSETYALVQHDYHTSKHGGPAPYTREAILGDIAELIATLRPSRIYVTSEADRASDHRTAFFLVRDAIRKTRYEGRLYTYLIHGHNRQWPWPRGVTPRLAFERPPYASQVTFPLPWPPNQSVALTAAQAHLKLLAIRCHKLPIKDPARNALHEANMESFVKSDEIFWQPQLKER